MSVVVIAGSRTIKDYSTVKEAIEEAIDERGFEIERVVSGKADGVDSLGERWADENDIPIDEHPVEDFFGDYPNKVAPLRRNEKMAEVADCAIIVWNGSSTGTKNMIEQAEEEDLDIHIFRTDVEDIDNWL